MQELMIVDLETYQVDGMMLKVRTAGGSSELFEKEVVHWNLRCSLEAGGIETDVGKPGNLFQLSNVGCSLGE